MVAASDEGCRASTSPEEAYAQVQAAHAEHFGAQPVMWASTPASWFVIGEHTDAAGGVVVCGLSDATATVAVTPRSDQAVRVHYLDYSHGEPVVTDDQTSLTSEQTYGVAAPSFVQSAASDVARRLAGVIQTAMGRQLIAREVRGADITVLSTITEGVGLGERAAVECATLLALSMHTKDRDEAPIRARLVEVAVNSAAGYSPEPPLKARYTAIMRGRPGTLQVVDYRDGSLTQAPHLADAGVQPVILALPEDATGVDVTELRQRIHFAADASKAFGVESLRHLPDAAPRVTAWLAAMHGAQRADGLPSAQQASAWMDFFDAETTHATEFINLVRSRRQARALVALERSRDALASALGVNPAAVQLSELACEWGAQAARPACAGLTDAVVAYLPAAEVDGFRTRAGDAGLVTVELTQATAIAG
ncbi:galactokinase family protein [Corynebacterium sp. 13CS0277]|uniref:galactokinase family protein n=1 Tax=Corynebacterium sp. 13CS0277 TaxID=2071994 RepID=UPI001304F605|nr:galactokinase family protein [Corynebacterium sp. 13CS0277]